MIFAPTVPPIRRAVTLLLFVACCTACGSSIATSAPQDPAETVVESTVPTRLCRITGHGVRLEPRHGVAVAFETAEIVPSERSGIFRVIVNRPVDLELDADARVLWLRTAIPTQIGTSSLPAGIRVVRLASEGAGFRASLELDFAISRVSPGAGFEEWHHPITIDVHLANCGDVEWGRPSAGHYSRRVDGQLRFLQSPARIMMDPDGSNVVEVNLDDPYVAPGTPPLSRPARGEGIPVFVQDSEPGETVKVRLAWYGDVELEGWVHANQLGPPRRYWEERLSSASEVPFGFMVGVESGGHTFLTELPAQTELFSAPDAGVWAVTNQPIEVRVWAEDVDSEWLEFWQGGGLLGIRGVFVRRSGLILGEPEPVEQRHLPRL